jgi:hypothetical protein
MSNSEDGPLADQEDGPRVDQEAGPTSTDVHPVFLLMFSADATDFDMDDIIKAAELPSEASCAPCALLAHGGSVDGGKKLGPPSADSLKALEGLTTTTDECAEDVEHAPGTPCATRKVLKVLAMFNESGAADSTSKHALKPKTRVNEDDLLPKADSADAKIVREAAQALGCNSESCVITHPSFRGFVRDAGVLPQHAIDLELETRYKAAGPRNSTALASDANIDETLRRWARVYPEFYPCPFTMMDFEKTGSFFDQVDMVAVMKGEVPANLGPGFGQVRRPTNCFGCVLNTDVSSGPGIHWVAAFVDCRGKAGTPWSVEFFNSVGNAPPKPVVRWMERTRAALAAYRRDGEVISVPVTDMDHQESQTECGLYAIYYIRRRLEGVPFSFFFQQIVPDDAMTMFRAHVFRAAR